MHILMYFKIQSDQPRITRNVVKSQLFDLFIYLCPDDDLVNKSKIRLYKAFSVILGWSLWILKYIKMHIVGLIFILTISCNHKALITFTVMLQIVRSGF